MDYETYKSQLQVDISECLENMSVQPILFVGSGLSQRYYGAPSWDGLLSKLAELCPHIDQDYAYYKQQYSSPIDVGSVFANKFREWAWADGKSYFPSDLFEASAEADIYIKYAAATMFEEQVASEEATERAAQFSEELEALAKIQPHALITTNYDRYLERVFPDYATAIGERILRVNYASVGEIYKIHGCSSDPRSLILTRRDYNEFESKKKYLSAKLLTFFSEHPLVLLGYSAEDPDIKTILADIDEILAPAGSLIQNIYLVQWNPAAQTLTDLPMERLIGIDGQRSVRVKNIVADDFLWVYQAFVTSGTLEAVNPKLLRALMARTYALVRHDLPRRAIEVDYETLEHALSEEGDLAKLYGITTLDNPAAVNAMYPFTLTQVGRTLGYNGWHGANSLIQLIEQEHGVNIKQSDNRYHVAFMNGTVVQAHKYSQEAIALLTQARDGGIYDIRLSDETW